MNRVSAPFNQPKSYFMLKMKGWMFFLFFSYQATYSHEHKTNRRLWFSLWRLICMLRRNCAHRKLDVNVLSLRSHEKQSWKNIHFQIEDKTLSFRYQWVQSTLLLYWQSRTRKIKSTSDSSTRRYAIFIYNKIYWHRNENRWIIFYSLSLLCVRWWCAHLT